MKQYIPSNLKIEYIGNSNPEKFIKRYNKDKLIHIFHMILSYPVDEDGLAKIAAKKFQQSVYNYKEYLDFMEDYGIIDIDKQFQYKPFPSIVRGYKFSEDYNTTVTSVEISNWPLIKKIKQQQQPPKNINRNYKHLAKWFNPKLQVDIDTAHKYLEFELPILKRTSQENFRNKENISNTWFDNYPDKVQELKKYKVKDPIRQYNYRYINLDKINDKNYELGVKGTSKRFYSILTSLNSDYRNFLRYNNQQLVSVDISNSQPYFSLKLLDPEFWERKQFQLLFSYNSTISLSINSSFPSSSSPPSTILVKTLHGIDKQEVELYKELVTSGELYDYLADLIKKETGIIYETRREKKAAIFTILYSDNRFLGQPDAAPKRVFRKAFPGIYELFSAIKRIKSNLLPVMLQRIESYMIVDKITKKISKEYPDLPIFTIHDSIATLREYENYLFRIMKQELTKFVGVKPKLEIEYWNDKNLKYYNLWKQSEKK